MRLRDLRNLNIQERIAVLETEIKNGCNVNVMYQSFPKLRKEFNGRVRKETTAVVCFGKSYRNLKVNQGREEESFQGLPSSQHFIIDNVLIEQNKDNVVSYLVRVYPNTLKNIKNETKWYFDNVEITKQELIERGIIKDTPHTEIPCWNVKLENLLALGKEREEA